MFCLVSACCQLIVRVLPAGVAWLNGFKRQPMPGADMPDTLLKPALPGVALKRWRLLHRVKQAHAAAMFNVTQSSISRCESGVQAMAPLAHAQLEQLLAARLDAAADQALARLVR